MIKIELVDYDNLTSLGIRLTQYVNSNIKDIVRVLLDVLETDMDFELDAFFPRDYLKKSHKNVGMPLMNYMKLFVLQIFEILLSRNMSICCIRY